MYCKKCGKFIDGDADICDDCYTLDVFGDDGKEKEIQAVEVTPVGNFSLAKPITAIVLSNIGFYIVYFGIMLMSELLTYELYSQIGGAVALALVGAVPCIVGLVFGIQSIKLFKTEVTASKGKRIPTLIMGIVSVVTSASGLLLAVIVLMLYAALL